MKNFNILIRKHNDSFERTLLNWKPKLHVYLRLMVWGELQPMPCMEATFENR